MHHKCWQSWLKEKYILCTFLTRCHSWLKGEYTLCTFRVSKWLAPILVGCVLMVLLLAVSRVFSLKNILNMATAIGTMLLATAAFMSIKNEY